MTNYTKHLKQTPQSEPIKGRESEMSINDAGGYGFTLAKESLVKRFMFLGSVGHYYASERDTVLRNYDTVLEMIKEDGVKLVEIIESDINNAPKKTPAIFMLALAKLYGNEATRRAVYGVIGRRTVIRTVGQLMDFLLEIHALNDGTIPMGAGFRKAIKKGFFMDAKNLAYQFTKYRARSKAGAKFTTLDLVRLMHVPGTRENGLGVLFQWVTGQKLHTMSTAPISQPSKYINEFLWAFEELQSTNNVNRVIEIVNQYNFSWEMIPNTWFSDLRAYERRKIWSALLEKMPMTALLRNMVRMGNYGVFDDSKNLSTLANSLSVEQVLKQDIHPIQYYAAYRQWLKEKSASLENNIVSEILASAFQASYGCVKPTNKRIAYFVDVSASMGSNSTLSDNVSNMPVLEACAILISVFLKTEPVVQKFVFDTGTREINIPKTSSIGDIYSKLSSIRGGGTNVSSTIEYLIKNKIVVDAIVILTDSESWTGAQTSQLFEAYKKGFNKDVKLVYIQMVGNTASLNDPMQNNSIEILGFDSNVPKIINSFVEGEF